MQKLTILRRTLNQFDPIRNQAVALEVKKTLEDRARDKGEAMRVSFRLELCDCGFVSTPHYMVVREEELQVITHRDATGESDEEMNCVRKLISDLNT